MSTSHGKSGVAKIGVNTVAEVTEFTYTENIELVQDTVKGDTSHSYLSGFKDGGGSVTCRFDPSDTNGQEAMTTGASVELHLLPDGSDDLTGTVTVESVETSSPLGDTNMRTFTFKGILTAS